EALLDAGHVIEAERAGSTAGHLVAIGEGNRELEETVACDQGGEPLCDRGVEAKRAPQERAPRERNGHEIGDAAELYRKGLDTRGHEDRIRAAALRSRTGRATRRLGHRTRLRVDAEGERVGVRGR